MGSKAPSLAGRWHWALQESRQSPASVLHLPCLTHGELCLLPGATSHIPCAWKGDLGAKDLLSTQHLGLLLSASAAFKGASQAWVTPGEITRFMHSRERQWSAVEANEGEEAAAQNKVTHFWTCYALKTSPEFTDSGFTRKLKYAFIWVLYLPSPMPIPLNSWHKITFS